MGDEVTISRPDVVAMIEEAAARLTGGDETEAVALAVRRLLASDTRSGTLFGRQPGSVRVREAVDLTAPAFDEPTDEETGCELEHCYIQRSRTHPASRVGRRTMRVRMLGVP